MADNAGLPIYVIFTRFQRDYLTISYFLIAFTLIHKTMLFLELIEDSSSEKFESGTIEESRYETFTLTHGNYSQRSWVQTFKIQAYQPPPDPETLHLLIVLQIFKRFRMDTDLMRVK